MTSEQIHHYPGRADLRVVEATLFGHKFVVAADAAATDDAPARWKKVPSFELERQIAVKRRSHYA